REACGLLRRQNLDLQPASVMIRQILFYLPNQLRVVRALLVQPENRRSAGCASACDSQFDPVLNGGVLGLTHAPDVAPLHAMLEQDCSGSVHDSHRSGSRNLERLVVRSVLFSCLRHEAHVRYGPHRSWIESAVFLTKGDGLSINTRVA